MDSAYPQTLANKEAQHPERAGKTLNRRMDKPEPAHFCGARSHETAKLARRRIKTVLNLEQLVEGWISVAILYGRTAVELFGSH